jgi:hypothetical protein
VNKQGSPLAYTRDGPMHEWFGLTYSSYLVLQRSLIQEMPIEWQARLRDLLDEMEETFDSVQILGAFRVNAVDEKGRFVKDPLLDYRRGPSPPRKKHVDTTADDIV